MKDINYYIKRQLLEADQEEEFNADGEQTDNEKDDNGNAKDNGKSQKNLIDDKAAHNILSQFDKVKDAMDKLKEAVSDLIDITGNFAENDLTPEQSAISEYAGFIMDKLDEIDDEAGTIEKDKEVNGVL